MLLFIKLKPAFPDVIYQNDSACGILFSFASTRWSKSGRWKLIFEAIADSDPIAVAIDSTTIRANQVTGGAKKTAEPTELGRSRGGLTTKIHFTVNAIGKFCRSLIGPGNESDFKKAGDLIKDYKPLIGMGDKGYGCRLGYRCICKGGRCGNCHSAQIEQEGKKGF